MLRYTDELFSLNILTKKLNISETRIPAWISLFCILTCMLSWNFNLIKKLLSNIVYYREWNILAALFDQGYGDDDTFAQNQYH